MQKNPMMNTFQNLIKTVSDPALTPHSHPALLTGLPGESVQGINHHLALCLVFRSDSSPRKQ